VKKVGEKSFLFDLFIIENISCQPSWWSELCRRKIAVLAVSWTNTDCSKADFIISSSELSSIDVNRDLQYQKKVDELPW